MFNIFKKQPEQIRMVVDPAVLPERKNIGDKGAVCNNCGGYGYTMKLKGGTLPCTHCQQSGVREESKEELQTKLAQQGMQIERMAKDLANLRQAILSSLGQEVKEPDDV